MKTTLYRLVCLLVLILAGFSAFADSQRDRSFDSDWRFLRADAPGAEVPGFNDANWRKLDLPHDWSIEDLPAADASASDQSATNRVGPFDRSQSKGGASTGYVVGGTGWYRKHFTLSSADARNLVAVRFDGVYMNADFWINATCWATILTVTRALNLI
ncbi:MAG TPA: sugar-binding domain-containing protein [Verrucomicrobiae bacterium]